MMDINDLLKELQNLDVSAEGDDNPMRPNKRLIQALKSTQFTIFEPIAELGYFGWEPHGSYKDLKDVTFESIQECIHVDMKPHIAAPLKALNSKLPKPFCKLPPSEQKQKYPNKTPVVVPLHVAARHRGVDITKVDFMFSSSSTLFMFATRDTRGKTYVVAVVPGTDIIVISKREEYIVDRSNFGFQFERFVAGNGFDDAHNSSSMGYMHLMDISGHCVFLEAEVDGMDHNGDPVEVTCSNPKYWGTSKAYQMLCNGSLTLYSGQRNRDNVLERVTEKTFKEMVAESFHGSMVKVHEQRIKASMAFLEKERKAGRFKGGKTFKISFDSDVTVLDPYQSQEDGIFVPDAVIKKLIH